MARISAIKFVIGAAAVTAALGSIGTATAVAAAPNGTIASFTRHSALSRELNASATSANWAGYAAIGGTYSQVTASWIQPTVSCAANTDYIGGSDFALTVTDSTQNWSYSTVQSVPNAPRSSAEVIAEDPGDPSGGYWPLADFGTAQFSEATVDYLPLSYSEPEQVDMAAGSVAKATTSALTAAASGSGSPGSTADKAWH